MAMFSLLPVEFYSRNTLVVAREVLGKVLVREIQGALLKGVIVEAEAYREADDPASHAYRGPTNRNRVMFGRAGAAYVYFTYGNHYCLNFVTEREGVAGAVLIRAVEPTEGVELMMVNRQVADVRNLTNGPGKLTKALSINREHNGLDLTLGKDLFVTQPDNPPPMEIGRSRRIGVKDGADKPWRFYVVNNPFISKKGVK